MLLMKWFMKDGRKVIEWELKDVSMAMSLLDGSAKPSDFDLPFTMAALLLAAYADALERSFSRAASASTYNIWVRDSAARARELARSFGEAGNLSGEWDEDNLSSI
jgi:hypothetical protein